MNSRKLKLFVFVLASIGLADLLLSLSGWQILVRGGGVVFPGEKFIAADYQFFNGDKPSLVCHYFNGRSRVKVVYRYDPVFGLEKCPTLVKANG